MRVKRLILVLFLLGSMLNGFAQNTLTDSLFSKAVSYYGQHMENGSPYWVYTNSTVSDSCLSLLQEVINNPGDSTLLDDALLLKAWLKADFSFPDQMDYPGCMSILEDLKNNFTSSTLDPLTLHLTVYMRLNGTGYLGPLGFVFQDAKESASYLKGLIPYIASAFGLAQDEDEAAIQFKNYFQEYPDRPLTYKAKFDYCPIGLNINTPQERISLYKDVIDNSNNTPLRNISLAALNCCYGNTEKEYVLDYVNQHSDNYVPFGCDYYFPLGNYTMQKMLDGQVSLAIIGNYSANQESYLDSTIAMYNALLSNSGVIITKDNSLGSIADIVVDFSYPEWGGQYNNGYVDFPYGDGIAVTKSNGYFYGGKMDIYNTSSDTLKEILHHEFGHVIGLGHSYFAPDLMYPAGNNSGILSHTDSLSITQLYSMPKIISATFSPSLITIPCTPSNHIIEFQATVTDPDGASDIAGVWIDLSRFGGSNAEIMIPQGDGSYTLSWNVPDSAFSTPLYKYSPIAIIYTKDIKDNINWKILQDFKISLVLLPASAGTISGMATVCPGQASVPYSVPAIANASGYTWAYSGTNAAITGTAENVTITFALNATSGNLTVKGTNSCLDGTSSTLSITVNPIPAAAGAITGETTVCQGQNSVTYTVPPIAAATSYVWSLPTRANGASTTNTITINYTTVAVSGDISVKAHNDFGDGIPSALAITVRPLPESAGAISGAAAVCQGAGTVIYSIPQPATINNEWYLPSIDELNLMFTNLQSFGMGDFAGEWYHSSSEFNNNFDWIKHFAFGNLAPDPKSDALHVRAVRNFTSSAVYHLRYQGPAGGVIFYIYDNGNGSFTYFEAAPSDQSSGVPWGCDGTSVGANGTSVGTGKANTQAILNSCSTPGIAARICADYLAMSNTYSWTVPPGWTITGGQGTTQIEVTVGSENGNITVTPSNSCGNGVSSVKAVTVSSLPVSSGTIIGLDSVCQGQNSVTYTLPAIANASSYVWTLPTGASGTSTTNTITVDFGTNAISGNITVEGNNICGESLPSNLFVTVTKKLQLKIFLEGLFNNSIQLMNKAKDENGDHFSEDIADQIDIEIRNSTLPYQIVYNINSINLKTDGTCQFTVPSELTDAYYLVIKNRNHIETWSAVPVSFIQTNPGYNFTDQLSKAFGNNLKLLGSNYCVYSGDVNQDGIIDGMDMVLVDNQSALFSSGFLPADLNGDGVINYLDMLMLVNNSSVFIGLKAP